MKLFSLTKQIPEDIQECNSILCRNCYYDSTERSYNNNFYKDHKCCPVVFRWWQMDKRNRQGILVLKRLMGFYEQI